MEENKVENIESNKLTDPLDVWLNYRFMTKDIIFDREQFHKSYQSVKTIPDYFKYAKKTLIDGNN